MEQRQSIIRGVGVHRMKKLLLCLLFLHSLFANQTLLDEYRLNGLENIEQYLDKELTKKEYWQEHLKNKDLNFGLIQHYNALLVCDKNNSTLKLYKKDSKNHFAFITKYNAFTGKNKGDKQNEGDLKTPVGIYNLTKKLNKLDPFYGPLAFVTSYPNLYDRYQNKNGHGIWIHGLPIDQKRDSFTKGCIAIGNDALVCLDKDIALKKTLVLIFENSQYPKTKPSHIAAISSWLYSWLYAWKYNDIEKYLSCYNQNFKRFDGKNLKEFARYKRAVFAQKQKKQIEFKDINIIPYPSHPKLYQITFYEVYKSNTYRFEGYKELLVTFDSQNNQISIISEK